MSRLLDVQQRYRELGRLRMGEKVATSNGKSRPGKLTEWRLTSANSDLLDVVAELYGGEVREWKGAPTEGKQFEVYTGTDRLDIVVPPGQVLTQSWELWSGGGCTRRCNGLAMSDGEACVCPDDYEERAAAAQKGQACKPTSRLSVVLPRVPDMGVWRVETHGMNAAVEMPSTISLLEKALGAGILMPAQLRIDQRTSKKNGETRHYIVAVVELPTITMEALMAGDLNALGAGTAPALGSPPPALPAARAELEPPKAEPVKKAAKRAAAAVPPLPGEDPDPSATAPASGGDGGAAGAAAGETRPAPAAPANSAQSVNLRMNQIATLADKADLHGEDLEAFSLDAVGVALQAVYDDESPKLANSLMIALRKAAS